MNKVTLKDLKEDLSSWMEKVFRGEVIQITKYNKPIVVMSPVREAGLLVGKRAGKGKFTPAIQENLAKKSLAALLADRDEDS